MNNQVKEHSIYLINYLRNLLANSISSVGTSNEESKMSGINNFGDSVGKNDKYLITKLKSYNITLDKIDSYLYKLRNESSAENEGFR